VIDRGRCTDCGQCLEFCLFGVYERDAGGRVTVAVPGSCKDGCPACARICPQGAITFPLHADPVINGTRRRSGSGVEVAVGAGLMEQLRERRARTRLLRPEIEAALADRDACLAAAAPVVAEDVDGGCTCECASPNVGAGAAPRTKEIRQQALAPTFAGVPAKRNANVGAGAAPRTKEIRQQALAPTFAGVPAKRNANVGAGAVPRTSPDKLDMS
jgi:NAD-dependent dihydropyrimidine dehydrogenase PreA subunit